MQNSWKILLENPIKSIAIPTRKIQNMKSKNCKYDFKVYNDANELTFSFKVIDTQFYYLTYLFLKYDLIALLFSLRSKYY